MNETEKELQLAISGFTSFKDYQNMLSCYLRIGKIKFIKNEHQEAKLYAEKATELCKTHKENYFIGECVSLLDRINENIRRTSLNVFVFLKAFPLVDPKDTTHVGPITQKHNKFKANILKNMKNEKKVLQVKFDILTRENLQTIKAHGCRVLHLCSDESRPDQLCAEGKYGEMDAIQVSEVRDLIFPDGAMLSIDVVVLAIPQSRVLAEVFVALGVPHVICFDFTDEFMYDYSSYDYSMNAPYECIYAFCEEFYKRLVKGISVSKSVAYGREKIKITLREVNKVMKVTNLKDNLIGEGAIILPEDFDHDQSLYGTKDWRSTQLQKGNLIDMSRIRGLTNVPKSIKPTVGRRVEIHKLVKYVCENKIVSLHGPPGIGKTHLAQTMSYYLN